MAGIDDLFSPKTGRKKRETPQWTLRPSAELAKAVESVCAETGRSLSQVCMALIEEGIRQYRKRVPAGK